LKVFVLLICLFCVNAVFNEDVQKGPKEDPLKHIRPEDPLKHIIPEDPLKHIRPEDPLKDLRPVDPLKDLRPVDPFKEIKQRVSNFTGFYQQSFDSLNNGGFDSYSHLPFSLEGWSSNQNSYLLSDGSRTTCGLMSFGRILKYKIHNQMFVDSDRSLGALTNKTIKNVWFGVSLNNVNNTNITKINISFWGEIWRSGGSNLSRYLLFFMRTLPLDSCLKVGFEDDTNSGWLRIPELEFETLENYHHQKRIDGKQPRNRRLMFTTLNMTSWPQNYVLQLKWEKPYLGTGDDALAIDDLKVEVIREGKEDGGGEEKEDGEGKTSKMGWKTWTIVIIVVIVVVVLAVILVVLLRKQKTFS